MAFCFLPFVRLVNETCCFTALKGKHNTLRNKKQRSLPVLVQQPLLYCMSNSRSLPGSTKASYILEIIKMLVLLFASWGPRCSKGTDLASVHGEQVVMLEGEKKDNSDWVPPGVPARGTPLGSAFRRRRPLSHNGLTHIAPADSALLFTVPQFQGPLLPISPLAPCVRRA